MRQLAVLRIAHKIVWMVALGTSLLSIVLAAEELPPAKKSVAEINIGTTRIDWLPLVDYERLVLTVAGPGDFYMQREFGAEETPFFNSLEGPNGQLPDGVYAYELRTTSKAQRPAEATMVQSGHLLVQGGNFVTEVPKRPRIPNHEPALNSPIRNVTANQTIPEDLIVQGQACIGIDCGAGDVNGPLLNLKEFGNTQIVLDGGGFHPAGRKWSLQANDFSVPSGDFLIRDLTAGTIPFRIGSSLGAPDNAFTIQDSTGNIGLGTLTPGAKLHLFVNATADVFGSAGPNPASGPAFNFGYGGASFGRGAGFLNVRPDASAAAPNPSLRFLTTDAERMIITNTGDIGIGTSSPVARLEIQGNASLQAVARLQNTNAFGYSGTEYLDNAGNVDLFFGVDNIESTARLNSIHNNPIVILTNSTERMRVTSGGLVGIGTSTPSSKFHVNGGDIRVSGGSFIDDGTTLNVPDYVFEPDHRLMPLDELKDFVSREKHLPNLPSAEDIRKEGLNLSQVQMRLLEKMEELTLYILKQNDEIRALQSENANLGSRLAGLEQTTTVESDRLP